VIPDKPGFTAFVFPGHEIELLSTTERSRSEKLAEMTQAAGGVMVFRDFTPANAGPPNLPCRLVDPDMFFAESPADVEAAKALCRECPIRDRCLAGAVQRREPWGVWGGELFVQGVIVARKRPRGRPRKHPLPEYAPAAAEADREAAA
jgi:WhiB family redox-sensing transcriptional regulator